jgi:hypothetical protein
MVCRNPLPNGVKYLCFWGISPILTLSVVKSRRNVLLPEYGSTTANITFVVLCSKATWAVNKVLFETISVN